MMPTPGSPQPAGESSNSALRRRFSALLGAQNHRCNCPMTESQGSFGPYAAKRGDGFRPHGGWRCADEAVKEPAVQRQLRIRRRHLECDPNAWIKKIFERTGLVRATAAHRRGRSLGDPVRRPRALWARGVAVVSAQLQPLTPQGRMINLKKRKRCMNSISSALSLLSAKRGGTRAGFIAEFPQNTRMGANVNGAAE